jgi:hypothetical protein
MNLDQVAWLEVAKALGPYAVAIIAIVGTFLSAGLAQRNWQKQFGVQQSVVLLNKRLQLAEELPSKLFEAVQHGSALLLSARVSEALNSLNSEGRGFSQEAIEGLVKRQEDAAQALQRAMVEALRLLVLTNAFFNEEIAKEAGECLSAMKQLIQSPEDASVLRNELKKCVPPDATVEQVLFNMNNAVNGHLMPISNGMSAQIGKLARLMVDYAKPDG